MAKEMLNKIIILTFLLLGNYIVIGSGCEGIISGHVYNAESRDPIEGAMVSFAPMTLATTTNSNGYYIEYRFCPETTYELYCYADGFEEEYSTVRTDANGNDRCNFYLTPINSEDRNTNEEENTNEENRNTNHVGEEDGSTEEGSTEEGSTEEGSTEEGSTEEGSTEEVPEASAENFGFCELYCKKINDNGINFRVTLTGQEYLYASTTDSRYYADEISKFAVATYYPWVTDMEALSVVDAALLAFGSSAFNPLTAGASLLATQAIRAGIKGRAEDVISLGTRRYPPDMYDGIYIDIRTSCDQPIYCPADWIVSPVLGSSVPAQSCSGIIHGRIINAASRAPVPKAKIAIRDSGDYSDYIYSGIADDKGNFLSSPIFCRSKAYSIDCDTLGYTPASQDVVTDENGNANADISISQEFEVNPETCAGMGGNWQSGECKFENLQ